MMAALPFFATRHSEGGGTSTQSYHLLEQMSRGLRVGLEGEANAACQVWYGLGLGRVQINQLAWTGGST